MLWVRLEATAGDEIRDTIADGMEISERLRIGVVFDVNDIDVYCIAGDSIDGIMARYERARKIGGKTA